MAISYISDIIEEYAHKIFKSNEKNLYKVVGKNNGWNEMTKIIDFSKLRVSHEKSFYENINTETPATSSVLFYSAFANDTDQDQEYRLSTERKTTSSCQIVLKEGYIADRESSFELEFDLKLPKMLSRMGFKEQYSLEGSSNKNIQEEVTWSIESNIKVPGKSQTIARLVIEEHQFKGRFEIKTYFFGKVSMKLLKNGTHLTTFDLGDLMQFFTSNHGFQKDENGIFIFSKCDVNGTYGIKQKVELKNGNLDSKF